MLKIEKLTKKYKGSDRGINDLTLTIYPGDICAFIGSNGAGKTTTLESVVGIQLFDTGEVILNDVSVKTEAKKFKQMLGYAPDNPDIYENLRGYEYLNFIGSMYKVPQKQFEESVSYLAANLSLTENLGQLISTYSHGMKQRLVLISLFLHDPDLIVLDEPFVGLDPNASYFLVSELQKRAAKGAKIIYSTHVLEVAEKLCNRVVLIDNGHVLINGEMKQLTLNESLSEVFRRVTAHA